MIVHPISPVYDKDSRILILGSFPSVKSREAGFFYGHPHNRFWKVTASICGEDVPQTIEEKRAFLLRNHIAVWDEIHSCEIEGSSDSSIRNVTVNDLHVILGAADIKAIYVNGKTALKYYQKYTQPAIGRPAICLPSTSPANAAWNMERLLKEWRIIAEGICLADTEQRLPWNPWYPSRVTQSVPLCESAWIGGGRGSDSG